MLNFCNWVTSTDIDWNEMPKSLILQGLDRKPQQNNHRSQRITIYSLLRKPMPETTRATPVANNTESKPFSMYSFTKYIVNKIINTIQVFFKYFIN